MIPNDSPYVADRKKKIQQYKDIKKQELSKALYPEMKKEINQRYDRMIQGLYNEIRQYEQGINPMNPANPINKIIINPHGGGFPPDSSLEIYKRIERLKNALKEDLKLLNRPDQGTLRENAEKHYEGLINQAKQELVIAKYNEKNIRSKGLGFDEIEDYSVSFPKKDKLRRLNPMEYTPSNETKEYRRIEGKNIVYNSMDVNTNLGGDISTPIRQRKNSNPRKIYSKSGIEMVYDNTDKQSFMSRVILDKDIDQYSVERGSETFFDKDRAHVNKDYYIIQNNVSVGGNIPLTPQERGLKTDWYGNVIKTPRDSKRSYFSNVAPKYSTFYSTLFPSKYEDKDRGFFTTTGSQYDSKEWNYTPIRRSLRRLKLL